MKRRQREEKLITFSVSISAVIDGVDTAGMSREQLEAFCIKLRNELEREREERNFFQIERDKLRTFWEITRKQYEDSQGTIRNKEREVEVAQEMADLDTKNVMQQMKHLQYENQSKIGEMRAEMMTQLKLAQEDHAIQERELFDDKRELKKLCREKDEFNELQIQQIKMKHSEVLSLEREKFQNEAKEMANLHERRLQEYMENSEIRHRMEMSEVEERKNNQIRQLIDCHEKAFGEMKSYYNDITINNLALISSIKEQMEEMRRQTERNEKQMADAHSGKILSFAFTLWVFTITVSFLKPKAEMFPSPSRTTTPKQSNYAKNWKTIRRTNSPCESYTNVMICFASNWTMSKWNSMQKYCTVTR